MKLVRHKIPKLAATNGHANEFRAVADDAEHTRLLDEKFDEELGEWRESLVRDPHTGDPMELADLLAVIRDNAALRGTTWPELLAMEAGKRDERGGFLIGVVWEGVVRRDPDTGAALPAWKQS